MNWTDGEQVDYLPCPTEQSHIMTNQTHTTGKSCDSPREKSSEVNLPELTELLKPRLSLCWIRLQKSFEAIRRTDKKNNYYLLIQLQLSDSVRELVSPIGKWITQMSFFFIGSTVSQKTHKQNGQYYFTVINA